MNLSRSAIVYSAAVLFTMVTLTAGAQLSAPNETVSGLKRQLEKPLDSVPGADIEYGVLETTDGSRLRTIFSKPADVNGRVPAIYFVQWLSCSTIELRDDDGWTQMLTHLIGQSGYAVMRTEKSGVGDSEGRACHELDYETEVEHHRESLRALFDRSDVDSSKIFVLGGSMGANQAPLIIEGFEIAGVIVSGGGAKTWYERMLGFDRRSLAFSSEDLTTLNNTLMKRAQFHTDYLINGRSPQEIIAERADMKAVWDGMIGTSADAHYGRPFAFHQQAQAANWPAAWAATDVPVLVLYGEFDWFEDVEGHRFIVEIVNKNNPGNADLHIIPAANHHFSRYPNSRAAFDETDGKLIGDEAARLITDWIAKNLTSYE